MPGEPGLSIYNYTNTTLTVNWNIPDGGDAEQFEIRLFKDTQMISAENVTGMEKHFMGLSAGNVYRVEVQAHAFGFSSSVIDKTQRLSKLFNSVHFESV